MANVHVFFDSFHDWFHFVYLFLLSFRFLKPFKIADSGNPKQFYKIRHLPNLAEKIRDRERRFGIVSVPVHRPACGAAIG